MKYAIVFFILVFSGTLAAQPESSFDEASAAYATADYATAIRLLHALEKEGFSSFPVYYNLGSAYYKNGNLGASMLYYEKALLLNPGNEDVLHNIRVVRARTRDRVEAIPLLFFVRWWNGIKDGYSAETFFWWSLALLWILALCLFVFFGYRHVLLRRLALVTVVVAGLLFTLSVSLYSARLEQLEAHRFAIIMPDETVVRSTPDASGVESFVIHEGLKIEILESRDQYYHIRLADGKSGWIQRSSAERI